MSVAASFPTHLSSSVWTQHGWRRRLRLSLAALRSEPVCISVFGRGCTMFGYGGRGRRMRSRKRSPLLRNRFSVATVQLVSRRHVFSLCHKACWGWETSGNNVAPLLKVKLVIAHVLRKMVWTCSAPVEWKPSASLRRENLVKMCLDMFAETPIVRLCG